MAFVTLSSSEFFKFEENKPITVIFLAKEAGKKYNRDLIRAYDREAQKEIVFPLYENIKLALSKINLKTGDLLRITWEGEVKTKNGNAKKFKVEYAPFESVKNEYKNYEKDVINVYASNQDEYDDKIPF
jgi:hypothetical protein